MGKTDQNRRLHIETPPRSQNEWVRIGCALYNLEAIRIADQHDWTSVEDGVRAREAIAFGAGRPDTIPLASYRDSPALIAAYANHTGAVYNHLHFLRDLRGAFERVRELIELGGQR